MLVEALLRRSRTRRSRPGVPVRRDHVETGPAVEAEVVSASAASGRQVVSDTFAVVVEFGVAGRADHRLHFDLLRVAARVVTRTTLRL
jgi:hypothetical protein